eukprot:3238769-Pleurochrysis_carterae.AAC.1
MREGKTRESERWATAKAVRESRRAKKRRKREVGSDAKKERGGRFHDYGQSKTHFSSRTQVHPKAMTPATGGLAAETRAGKRQDERHKQRGYDRNRGYDRHRESIDRAARLKSHCALTKTSPRSPSSDVVLAVGNT